MELQELKKNWNIMDERLSQLDMESCQLKTKTVDEKLKQMRNRLFLRVTFVVFFLPLSFSYLSHYAELQFSLLTWILLLIFVAIVISRQFTWMWLLKKIDCTRMTVREVFLAENRFRIAFKIGIGLSAVCAIPLLASMIWDMAGAGDRYLLVGAWTGLAVGLLIGIRMFLKAWRGVKELKEAVADLK